MMEKNIRKCSIYHSPMQLIGRIAIHRCPDFPIFFDWCQHFSFAGILHIYWWHVSVEQDLEKEANVFKLARECRHSSSLFQRLFIEFIAIFEGKLEHSNIERKYKHTLAWYIKYSLIEAMQSFSQISFYLTFNRWRSHQLSSVFEKLQ